MNQAVLFNNKNDSIKLLSAKGDTILKTLCEVHILVGPIIIPLYK